MVRRRNARDSPKTTTKKPRIHKTDAKVRRWESRDDIPLDGQEQFHQDRDKILLEGDDDWDDDDLGGRNEVFSLNGLQNSSADDDDDDESQEEEGTQDSDSLHKPPPGTSGRSKSKTSNPVANPESGSDDEDTWGRKQAAYYVDGDDEGAAEGGLDEVDEQELEIMEEDEARRLQRKLREDVAEDDYGVGFIQAAEEEKGVDLFPDVITGPTAGVDKVVLLKGLESTSPETLALAREWQDVADDVVRVELALNSKNPADPAMGLMHLHYQTLLTYATILAFYLHLRASPSYASRPHLLSSHPIMARLLSLKTGLSELEALGCSAADSNAADTTDEEDEEDDDDGLDEAEIMALLSRMGIGAEQLKKVQRMGGGLSKTEALELLMEAATEDNAAKSTAKRSNTHSSKLKSTSARNANGTVPSPQEPPAFDLVEPTFESVSTSSKKSSKSTFEPHPSMAEDDLDFVEPSALSRIDAADKAARKRALQFHTGKIARKTRQRGKAERAMAGDDDIPYQEDPRRRKKERDLKEEGWAGDEEGDEADPNAVPLTNGRQRVWGEGPSKGSVEHSLPSPSGSGGQNKRHRVDSDQEEPTTDYLELVKSSKRSKKEEKREAFEASEEEKRQAYTEDTVLGPRTPSRNIVRNKGLARQRGKGAVNPRVRKRMQYDKAKKKLSSQKAVYKGGLTSLGGVYEGEQTGINSRVIKSVKFG